VEVASMVQEYPRIRERRKRPDKFIKIVNALVLVSIFIVMAIILIALEPGSNKDLKMARPLQKIFGEPVEANMMRAAFYLMVFQLGISIAGFALSMFYHKRRNDRYHYSLVVFGVLSLTGIVYYLFYY
jgi:hypothetical protein